MVRNKRRPVNANKGADSGGIRCIVTSMKFTRLFLWSLPLAMALQAHASELGPKKVTLSAYNTLKFSVSKIEVRPGQTVILTLKNDSYLPRTAMEHCWVLLKKGVDPNKYAVELIKAEKDKALAKKLETDVLVSTKDLGPQESDTITFTAPKDPGSYPYMCDSPMHCQDGMQGVLIVK